MLRAERSRVLECDIGSASVAATEDGWSTVDVGEPPLPLPRLEGQVERLATQLGSPGLAAFVETSDFGYVAASEAGAGIVVRGIVNPRNAEDSDEGVWALERVRSVYGRPWKATPARQLVEWSRHTPRRISPDQAKRLLYTDHLFPEQALEELFLLLGLPVPQYEEDVLLFGEDERLQGALWLWSRGRREFAGLNVDFGRSRYIPGIGTDFFGIWDRNEPGPPIRRYPKTSDGVAQAEREWIRLQLGDIGRFRLWILRRRHTYERVRIPGERKRL